MKERTKSVLIGIASGIIGGSVLIVVDGIFLAANIVCLPVLPVYAGIMGYVISKEQHKLRAERKGIDVVALQDAARKDFQKWKIEKVDESEVPEHIREFLKQE